MRILKLLTLQSNFEGLMRKQMYYKSVIFIITVKSETITVMLRSGDRLCIGGQLWNGPRDASLGLERRKEEGGVDTYHSAQGLVLVY